MDLEGILAERLTDPYEPGSTTWWKVLASAMLTPAVMKKGLPTNATRGSPESA
jgi:hypothetical protein